MVTVGRVLTRTVMDVSKICSLYGYEWSSLSHKEAVTQCSPLGPVWEIMAVGTTLGADDKFDLLEWVPNSWCDKIRPTEISPSCRLARRRRTCPCTNPYLCVMCPKVW